MTSYVEQPPSEVQAPAYRRHALGLPAGSVRALLALGVLGLLWAIVLRYDYGGENLADRKMPLAFVYLQFLMVLIVAHFFAAHGNSIGRRVSYRSPLGLPRGSIRLLLLAGYLGLAVYLYRRQPEFAFPTQGQFVLLTGVLVTGFFIGHVATGAMRILGRGQVPDWFNDFEAWVALLSLFGLGVLVIVHVFINPSVSSQEKLDIPTIEASLAAVLGFYFGARS